MEGQNLILAVTVANQSAWLIKAYKEKKRSL